MARESKPMVNLAMLCVNLFKRFLYIMSLVSEFLSLFQPATFKIVIFFRNQSFGSMNFTESRCYHYKLALLTLGKVLLLS
jgi:hypothetical protein